MPFLADDIYSKMNPSKLYARKGTEVTVRSNRAGILCVIPVGQTIGFHVFPEELTDYVPEPPASAAVLDLPPLPKSAPTRKGKAAKPPSPNTQASLF
jgi:hypothetical protein